MKRLSILCVLLAVLTTAVVTSCGKKHEDMMALPDCEVTAPLDSFFSAMFPANEPGAIVGVMRHGQPVYLRGFGMADLSKGESFTDSSQINIVSITKTCVTAAIMKLVAAGRLSLDASVHEFFPDFGCVFDSITLRQILSHTSGLPDKRPRNPNAWATYIKKHDTTFGLNSDYMLYGRENEMIRFFEGIDTLETKPGSIFRYQDAPFMLLSTVIEKASGIPFETYMRDSIFTPAGMNHTFFFDPEKPIPNEVHAYAPTDGDEPDNGVFVSSDGKWEEYDYGEAAFFPTMADRGIYTTPRDMFRWFSNYFGGKVIPEDMLKEVFTWQVNTKVSDVGYGLGLFLSAKPAANERFGFSMGYNGGFSSFGGYYPESGTTFFILANRPDWNRLNVGRAVDKIIRNAYSESDLLN